MSPPPRSDTSAPGDVITTTCAQVKTSARQPVAASGYPHPYLSPRPHTGMSNYGPVRTSAYPKIHR